MNDQEIIRWIEENLTSLRENGQDLLEMEYIGLDGSLGNLVVGESLRECVKLAVKNQKSKN